MPIINDKTYVIEDIGNEWVSLRCNGSFVAKLIDVAEARRVIYQYWTQAGVNIEPITAEDFKEIV